MERRSSHKQQQTEGESRKSSKTSLVAEYSAPQTGMLKLKHIAGLVDS
jgi:hypothetical protein